MKTDRHNSSVLVCLVLSLLLPDTVTVVSGSRAAVLDPDLTITDDGGVITELSRLWQNDNQEAKDEEEENVLRELLLPMVGVLGFDSSLSSFPGTLFRLPLRMGECLLCLLVSFSSLLFSLAYTPSLEQANGHLSLASLHTNIQSLKLVRWCRNSRAKQQNRFYSFRASQASSCGHGSNRMSRHGRAINAGYPWGSRMARKTAGECCESI